MNSDRSLGVWFATNPLTPEQLVELATGVEELGYDTLWYPESLGYESLSLAGYLLSHTGRLRVGSGIANIYARDAVAAAAGYDTLNTLHGDRFIMGLGVSHVPIVEDRRGAHYGKPLAAMRHYLDGMDKAPIEVPGAGGARNIVLAALGPKMLDLARQRTKGALPYNVTPEHTRMAREALGPGAWLCVEQKICLTSDPEAARATAKKHMARYLPLPNYRNNWLRIGFSEDEIGGERFLDAMVAWGDEAAVQSVIDDHFAAGADHVCLQPLPPDGALMPDWNALKIFAPA